MKKLNCLVENDFYVKNAHKLEGYSRSRLRRKNSMQLVKPGKVPTL